MKNPKRLICTLSDVKETVHKWLYLEHDEIIDVIMGAYIANQINTDPLWLLIISPPSNTKTELLRGFEGHDRTYFISTLTPSTLVSGLSPKNKPDPSLLPKLNNKIVIFKDFTSVLSMRSENKQEILSQLREIYDGKYNKAYGTGKVVDWRGRVGLIAACTPVYDKHYGTISSLGDRFLLYRTNTDNQEEMGLRAYSKVGQEAKMRKEISYAFHKFVKQFENLKDINFKRNDSLKKMIVNLACFCAFGRCAVERDYRTQNISYLPQPEGSPRLTKQFNMIGMGIALAQGKNCFDADVYGIVRKIAHSVIPAHRKVILEYLWNEEVFVHLGCWKKTNEVTEAVGLPKSTTKLVLEDLQVVGMLNKSLTSDTNTEEEKRTPYKWQYTDKAHDYALKSGIFGKENEAPF